MYEQGDLTCSWDLGREWISCRTPVKRQKKKGKEKGKKKGRGAKKRIGIRFVENWNTLCVLYVHTYSSWSSISYRITEVIIALQHHAHISTKQRNARLLHQHTSSKHEWNNVQANTIIIQIDTKISPSIWKLAYEPPVHSISISILACEICLHH